MFKKQIPFYYTLLCVLVASGATYFVATKVLTGKQTDEAEATELADNATLRPNCEYGITRLAGFKHIGPIISAAQDCEAEKLMPLKMSIASYIDNERNSENIVTASVYIRQLTDDSWIEINPNEVYHPASLLKVPQMITYLKKAELEPGLLDKEYLFVSPLQDMPTQYYSAKTLQPGHKYSVKELFHFMIAYSDNNANVEIVNHMDMNIFNQVFNDLHLPPTDLTNRDYQLSPRAYSKFLEVLYNASYLTTTASEYATGLLAQAVFKDGIIKKLPKTIVCAHKMGEWGDGYSMELHDCGIVYLENRPYIITIMTRGNDMEKMSETIANISKMTFDNFSSPAF